MRAIPLRTWLLAGLVTASSPSLAASIVYLPMGSGGGSKEDGK